MQDDAPPRLRARCGADRRARRPFVRLADAGSLLRRGDAARVCEHHAEREGIPARRPRRRVRGLSAHRTFAATG